MPKVSHSMNFPHVFLRFSHTTFFYESSRAKYALEFLTIYEQRFWFIGFLPAVSLKPATFKDLAHYKT